MSRRKAAIKKIIAPDYKFGSVVVSKFINSMMECGRKETARKIFYSAINIVAQKSGSEPLEAFQKVIENVRPLLECAPKRIGGHNITVPRDVSAARAQTLAIRWLIDASRKRRIGTSMVNGLANEFIDAIDNKGNAVKKKIDTHKMAEANRAFATFKPNEAA